MYRLFVLALVAVTASAAAPPAPGKCGSWVSQTNGTMWRMCSDAQNHQYCELKSGTRITRIRCP